MTSKSFVSNVGTSTLQAKRLLSADLIAVHDVSMTIHWVAQRVFLTPQSISDDADAEFGSRKSYDDVTTIICRRPITDSAS
jgi:hypothetical protein